MEIGRFCGDFNVVRKHDERFNSKFCPRVAADFNSFISDAGLIVLNMGTEDIPSSAMTAASLVN